MWTLVGPLAGATIATAAQPAWVCDILAQPQAFVGKTVTINTRLDVGGRAPVLRGETCDAALPFTLSPAARQSPEWRWIAYQRFGRRDVARIRINGARTEVTGVIAVGVEPDFATLSLEPVPYLRIETFNGLTVPPLGSEPVD